MVKTVGSLWLVQIRREGGQSPTGEVGHSDLEHPATGRGIPQAIQEFQERAQEYARREGAICQTNTDSKGPTPSYAHGRNISESIDRCVKWPALVNPHNVDRASSRTGQVCPHRHKELPGNQLSRVMPGKDWSEREQRKPVVGREWWKGAL